MAEGSGVQMMNGSSTESSPSPPFSMKAVTLGDSVHRTPSTGGTYIMPGPAHLKVALKLKTPAKVSGGEQHSRFGVVGNCRFLGDGDPQRARIGHQTVAQTWVVEIWVPANFVFGYRWVEFKRCTSYIFEIEAIEPRRVEMGLRALEVQNKFNIAGGTFKEDIGHPVYFTSFCAPKRSLDSSSLNTRPRPCSPEPAASKTSSTSRGVVYRQKRQQASDEKGEMPKGAVDGAIRVKRENHTSTPASFSSSEDNTSDNGSNSSNITATAARKSVSTDTEVSCRDSESSHTRTSMAEGGVQVQTASTDESYPSMSFSVEPVDLRSFMHSLPSTGRTYVLSDSLVARPCASTSVQSPSRQRHHASVSATDIGSSFHPSVHHNMEAFDALSHDLELASENLTNGLKESFCAPKRSLDSSSLNTRPRPCSPEPAASKTSSTSRGVVYRQKRQQASDEKGEMPKGAVDGAIRVERENNTSTPASFSSSEDNTTDDGSNSSNIIATAARKSVSTDTEVSCRDSESSHTRTSMAEGGVQVQTASTDESYPSMSFSVEPVHLRSFMHSLPSTGRTYVPSDSLVARPCASTSVQSPSRQRHHASVSATDIGSSFHSSVHHNMEAFDALSHYLELASENLTNGLKESFCAPKRSLDSSSLNTRPRPCSPEPAASKTSSTSRGVVYRQKRQQASDEKGEMPKGAVDGAIRVERENHTSTPASFSSSEDNTSDDGSNSSNITATAVRKSVSTDTEVSCRDSESSHTRTSMAEGGVQVQTASTDESYPSMYFSVEPVHLRSFMHSLPSTGRTYVPSDSLVARPCASTSVQSPSRQRHHASVSATDIGSSFHSSVHHNMEAFDALSHDLELVQSLGVPSENLTNGLKEYPKTTRWAQKSKGVLRNMLSTLGWLILGAALHCGLRYILVGRLA